jgi:tetratricopeptide (TPR) repeat protein
VPPWSRRIRTEEAAALFERAHAIQRRVLGEDHADTLRSLNNIGVLHHLQGQLDTAIDWYRRALERCLALLGPDDPDTLRTQHNLGEALKDQGRPEEGRALLEAAFEGRQRILGPGQPDTLETQRVLVDLLSLLGAHDEAIALAENLVGRAADVEQRGGYERLLEQVLVRAEGAADGD